MRLRAPRPDEAQAVLDLDVFGSQSRSG